MIRQTQPEHTIERLQLNIHREALALAPQLVAWRRELHRHPEIGFEEVRTARFIVENLRSFGITEIFEKVGKTGVVALIRGGKPGPCVGLRADMDGLPVQESKSPFNAGYCSEIPDRMHACGHDGHVSILLATAKILFAQRQSLSGVVKLIFQPCEEALGGANVMIADGVLEEGKLGPKVDMIYGLHIMTSGAVGKVMIRQGPAMAGSDRFVINVTGRGGHAGMPSTTVDTVLAASHLVTQLHTIVARNIPAHEPAVLTVGMIHGGSAPNIIPKTVTLGGTVRWFSKTTQSTIKRRIGELCKGIEISFAGTQVSYEYQVGTPCTDNASKPHVDRAKDAAASVVTAANVREPAPVTGAEDFSEFLLKAPGCFAFIGGSLNDLSAPGFDHHCDGFDFDERCLLVGVSFFVSLVGDILRESRAKL